MRVFELVKSAGSWSTSVYQQMMHGKMGEQCNRHIARLITNSYKTTVHWFKSHPQVFGVRKHQSEIDTEGLVGRQVYKCIDCPLCAQELEDMPHMFGSCSHTELVSIRRYADNEAVNIIMEVMYGTHGLIEMEKGSNQSSQDILGHIIAGRFCIVGGSTQLVKSVCKALQGVQWLKYAGVVNKSLKHMLTAIAMEGKSEQLCTYSLGAKMGVGKDRGCQCCKCEARDVVDPLFEKLIMLYVKCGMDIWKQRGSEWGEYCEIQDIVVPRAGVVGSGERGGTWGGEEAEVWESDWVVEDEEQLEEQNADVTIREDVEVDREVRWGVAGNAKYDKRQEEHDNMDRQVRVWCGYPVKVTSREKANARKREAGLSRDIREFMDVEDEEEREELEGQIEDLRESIAGRRSSEGEGCEVHVMGSERDRASEVLDVQNCGECKSLWESSLEVAREELGLRPRERRRVEVEGDSVDDQLSNMLGRLELKWEWLDKGWQVAIQGQAKQLRACHTHKKKECKTCELAKLSAQFQWEQRYVAKRKGCLEKHGGGKRRRVE